jgi:hypothetical protein
VAKSAAKRPEKAKPQLEALREKLEAAQMVYEDSKTDQHVARMIRDGALIAAHRAGVAPEEIAEAIGEDDVTDVVRIRRRAMSHREVLPVDLLSPSQALRLSTLNPSQFIDAVRDGKIEKVLLEKGAVGFKRSEVEALIIK